MSASQGTSIVWTSSGGDETLTLTSMANGEGRAGDEHDFGATYEPLVRIQLDLDFNAAPSAGDTMDVYWSSSIDGTNYDGECTGSDAAYNDENHMRRLHPVGALVVTGDTDAQRASWMFYLPSRYGLPVVSHQADQALTATGTDQKVTVTPINEAA